MTNTKRQDLIDQQLQLLVERSRATPDLNRICELSRSMAQIILAAAVHGALAEKETGETADDPERWMKGVL